MKRLLFTLLGLLALSALGAAPAPPQITGIVGTPTNGFWMTNRYFVFTNTAARLPKIDLAEVTIYGTNTLKSATVLAWTPPTNTTGLANYKVYYGKTSGTGTNYYLVNTNITSVAFYSTLDTNQWWAYVTSFDTNGLESSRSAQILFTPK